MFLNLFFYEVRKYTFCHHPKQYVMFFYLLSLVNYFPRLAHSQIALPSNHHLQEHEMGHNTGGGEQK